MHFTLSHILWTHITNMSTWSIHKVLTVMWITKWYSLKQSSNTLLFLQKETHTTQHTHCCMKVDPYLMKLYMSWIAICYTDLILNSYQTPVSCLNACMLWFFSTKRYPTWNETRLHVHWNYNVLYGLQTLHRLRFKPLIYFELNSEIKIKLHLYQVTWNHSSIYHEGFERP